MIITTTPNIEGKQIVEYKQVVFGEVIAGANFIRDFFAAITDVIGGRSSVYERRISRARQDALKELEEKAIALGANAVVGVEINYATVSNKSMFMVIASGSAGVAKVESIYCVFSVLLKNVTVDINQRYLFVNKGHFYEIDETVI